MSDHERTALERLMRHTVRASYAEMDRSDDPNRRAACFVLAQWAESAEYILRHGRSCGCPAGKGRTPCCLGAGHEGECEP